MAAWKIDAGHSQVGFSVRHMVVTTVRGHFGVFAGTINYDEANPLNSSVEAEADAASINTNDERRDGHIRTADFFEVEKFPKLTFKSTSVEKGSGDTYKVTGDFTLRGVTKPVTLTVESTGVVKDGYGLTRAGFTVTGKINRRDFGVAWGGLIEAGGAVVSDEVKLEFDLAAVQQ
jgi:polyisoprenoid-binding protein YceI